MEDTTKSPPLENGSNTVVGILKLAEDIKNNFPLRYMKSVPDAQKSGAVAKWGNKVAPLSLESLIEHSELLKKLTVHLKCYYECTQYNSVKNFIRFYEDFKGSKKTDLKKFFLKYEAKLTNEHCTSAGLAIGLKELLTNLESSYAGISNRIFFASSECTVLDDMNKARFLHNTHQSDRNSFNWEMSHVVVAINICIGKTREGVIIMDPASHIPTPVTVMVDRRPPHTGRFSQDTPLSDDGFKVSNFAFVSDTKIVTWKESFDTEKVFKTKLYAINVLNPLLNPVTVLEKGNLINPSKTMLMYNSHGSLLSGFTFTFEGDGKSCLQFHCKEAFSGCEEVHFDKSDIEFKLSESQQERLLSCVNTLSCDPEKTLADIHALFDISKDETFVADVLACKMEVRG